jgi:hypothetical protein
MTKLSKKKFKICDNKMREVRYEPKLFAIRCQCYKTFYRGNLPPFHGNSIILCYKHILPWKLMWNGSKLPQYINPRKSRVRITEVIYHHCTVIPSFCVIKLYYLGNYYGMAVNYHSILTLEKLRLELPR